MKRPNILLITSDQQHYSTLGSVNDKIKTPALDKLAADGVRFDRAYCPNPTCTPTRATIITGMMPSEHGAWSLGTKLFEDVPTVGDALGRTGYFTALIGKAHFQPLARTHEYESIECQPLLRDLDYWRDFTGPWYGFEHIELCRNHADESHCGQHYAIWMEEQGFTDWRDYYQPWPPEQGRSHGYDVEDRHWPIPEEYHYTTWTAERSIAQIDHAVENEQPFFIWSSFHDPHPPYLCPEPWASMYDPADMSIGQETPGEHDKNPEHFQKAVDKTAHPWWREANQAACHAGIHGGCVHRGDDQEKLRKDMACYYGMTSFMDHHIGRILDHLDKTGQADNTIVVFTTDHGHFIGQHGLTEKAIHHYEDLLKIPFIVRMPEGPTGDVSSAIQNLVDLAPTFLAAAGVDKLPAMTGVSQLETWAGGEDARTGSITENHHGTHGFHMRTYVNARYKITVYRDGDQGELFDLQEDPGEINNLWADADSQNLKRDMLHEFMQATLQSEPMRMPRISGA